MRGAAYPAPCDKLLFRDKFDKLSVNRKGDENLPVYANVKFIQSHAELSLKNFISLWYGDTQQRKHGKGNK